MAKIKLRLHPPSAAPSAPPSASPSQSPRASASVGPSPPPAPTADPELDSEEADELEDDGPPPPPPPSKPAKKKKRVSGATAHAARATSAAHDDTPSASPLPPGAGEFDDLPPAKRRKANLKAGNMGPGRGWRKGLKLGQKPPYAPPASPRPAEDPPSSRPVSPAPPAARSAAGGGGKRGRTVLALSAAPVKPPPKLTIGFAPGGALTKRDLATRTRHWHVGARMIPTLGGGALVVPTYWAGPDRDFDPHARAQAALQEARATNNVKAVIEVPGAVVRSPPDGIGTRMDQRAAELRGSTRLPSSLRDDASASASPAPDTKHCALAARKPPVSGLAAATAEPSPVPSSPAGEMDNWRGSSPAFVFAATEA